MEYRVAPLIGHTLIRTHSLQMALMAWRGAPSVSSTEMTIRWLRAEPATVPSRLRADRHVPHLQNRLIDFLHYENAHGRTVILLFPKGVDVDAAVAQALARTPHADVVRPDDPAFIVHSTTLAAWEMIGRDGQLRAASHLAQQLRSLEPASDLERYLQGEPPEYSDYIMFGEIGSTTPERIVASYQAGRFMFDDDAVYEPGVRLYFDNHRIIRDNRITRDGLHTTKVRGQLPLTRYLLAAIQWPIWTPGHRSGHGRHGCLWSEPIGFSGAAVLALTLLPPAIRVEPDDDCKSPVRPMTPLWLLQWRLQAGKGLPCQRCHRLRGPWQLAPPTLRRGLASRTSADLLPGLVAHSPHGGVSGRPQYARGSGGLSILCARDA